MQKLTNHIAFVIDESGSMFSLTSKVIQVFDAQIKYLRDRAEELNQETRASIYLFSSSTRCIVFDMDVMRVKSLDSYYHVHGQTALMDATAQALDDLKQIPELHSDHAFLVYVLTDGEENASVKTNGTKLATLLKSLPENWTIAAQVPNTRAVHAIKQFGFTSGNVEIWDSTTSHGMEKVGKVVTASLDTYLRGRATGIRGTRNFFQTNLSTVSENVIKTNLTQLSTKAYDIFQVRKDFVIKPFVESFRGSYVIGSAYYELVKPEDIQHHKSIAIQHKTNGKVYLGDAARSLLALPNHEIRVRPGDHGNWRIFVQSTSVNRKLPAGTQVLVMQ